jgi:PAS domain-containing protein
MEENASSSARLWPKGAGLAKLVREHDWAATPLGSIQSWPQSLRTIVDLALSSPVATIVLWGEDNTQIYNDRWAWLMGAKHPAALGQPTQECFPEIAESMASIYSRLREGEGVVLNARKLPIQRGDAIEDAWWNVHYLPARDESGVVAGVFCTVVEVTSQGIAERGWDEANATLQKSEQRLRDVLDGMSEAFGLMDRDLRIIT